MFVRLTAPKVFRPLATSVPVLIALTLLSGCGRETYPANLHYPVRSGVMLTAAPTPPDPPSRFDEPGELDHILAKLDDKELRSKSVDTSKLSPPDRAQYQESLDQLFGTPAAPIVGVDDSIIAELQLQPERLAVGSKLYRRHCLHCHGLTGDGRGPTAPWVNPHPRDYRRGIFKFTSSSQSEGTRKPRRADLLRTLQEGIDGTSMPSFRLLPPDDLEALASYVIHLSLRGQTEFNTLRQQLTTTLEDDTVATALSKNLNILARYWVGANGARIEPGAYPANPSEAQKKESIRNGFRLFVIAGPKSASCISCHKDFGRQSPLSYDEWGTIDRPADLTAATYRGGRRPLDLYNRIHSGINGSGMTAFGGSLSSEQIWDLVNFLQALPYPQMLPDDIRARIYAEP